MKWVFGMFANDKKETRSEIKKILLLDLDEVREVGWVH